MKYLVKRISNQQYEIQDCIGCTPSAELFDDILQAREAKKQAFVNECKKVNSKIAKEICDFLLPE